MVFKKLLQHLATRGTYSPGDWRCDEAWREQTLVYPPVICQQRLIYCTCELSVMYDKHVATKCRINQRSWAHQTYLPATQLFSGLWCSSLHWRKWIMGKTAKLRFAILNYVLIFVLKMDNRRLHNRPCSSVDGITTNMFIMATGRFLWHTGGS